MKSFFPSVLAVVLGLSNLTPFCSFAADFSSSNLKGLYQFISGDDNCPPHMDILPNESHLILLQYDLQESRFMATRIFTLGFEKIGWTGYGDYFEETRQKHYRQESVRYFKDKTQVSTQAGAVLISQKIDFIGEGIWIPEISASVETLIKHEIIQRLDDHDVQYFMTEESTFKASTSAPAGSGKQTMNCRYREIN